MEEKEILLSELFKSLHRELLGIRTYTDVCYGETEHRFLCVEVTYTTEDDVVRIMKLRPLRRGTFGEYSRLAGKNPDDIKVVKIPGGDGCSTLFWSSVHIDGEFFSFSGDVADYTS